jgi:DNA-binding IclR family transcriptional regulator
MAEQKQDDINDKIIELIESLRDEYGACTARLVADRIKMNRELIRSRLATMKVNGVVDWSEVPGSLRVVAKPKGKKN